MTKFYYMGSVAFRVKVLQIESKCSWFKPHYALSCYLTVLQPTLSHYQKGSPTTSMLITALSTIVNGQMLVIGKPNSSYKISNILLKISKNMYF